MKKAFSVACYVVAGFFVYMMMFLSFINEPRASTKLPFMGVFAVPAAISLFLGLHASRYANWQRDLGIVFLSSSLFTILLVVTFACMLASSEFTEMFPDNRLDFFSDYISGTLSIVTFLGLGGLLIWQSRHRKTTVE